MAMSVKAILQDGDVRRFQTSGTQSYDYLRMKICRLYPDLASGNFSLYWQDSDGDRVRFSTHEEYKMAMAELKDDTFRVYIKAGDTPAHTTGPTPGATPTSSGICDVCHSGIPGTRYKCCVCPEFKICSGCEQTGVHGEHMMVRVVRPFPDVGTLSQWFTGCPKSTTSPSTPGSEPRTPHSTPGEDPTGSSTDPGSQFLRIVRDGVSNILGSFGLLNFDVAVTQQNATGLRIDVQSQSPQFKSDVGRPMKEEATSQMSVTSPDHSTDNGTGDNITDPPSKKKKVH